MTRARRLIPELQLSPNERDHGVIVTVREQRTHEMRSFEMTGERVFAAVRRAIDVIDELDGDWRIVSISSPRSIFRDLHGRRGERARSEMRREQRLTSNADPRSYEQNLLAKCHRLDLLEPIKHLSALDEPDKRRRR